MAIKNGDLITIKSTDGAGGYLSWFKGNWVVLSATAKETAQQWKVSNLGTAGPGGKTSFHLTNLKSGTKLDGDNDNSVVLDDNDHSDWYLPFGAFRSGYYVRIANIYWPEYYLKDRGDTDRSRDVVLRKNSFTSFQVVVIPQTSQMSKIPQWGYAHRVNSIKHIKAVLDSGANGIEIDITLDAKGWQVWHNGDYNPPLLKDWLAEFKTQLGTNNKTFSSLWLDIKTPNEGDAGQIVDLVRLYVPIDVAVIYDIGSIENFSTETTGFVNIRAKELQDNEGFGVWIEDSEEVIKFCAISKACCLTRTVVHHGHAADIDENILVEINKEKFHKPDDDYRFKKVFTWTNALERTMKKYMDTDNNYKTDGQIVGAPLTEWAGDSQLGDLLDFDTAVASFSSTHRKAERSLKDFWEGSAINKK
jgi:hypothetical protein